MGTVARYRPLLLGLLLVAVIGALVGLFLWAGAPDAPEPVRTVDRLPSAPAPAAARRPDGGFVPHRDRAGLPPAAPAAR
jgi:hypothetical protein